MTELRERLAGYHAARERVWARWHSGRDARPDLDGLYAGFEDLAAGDPLDAARRAHQAARFDEEREAERRLLSAAEAAAVEASLRGLIVDWQEREASARVRVGAHETSAFAARLRADVETDADARADLARGLDAVDADLAPLREEVRAAVAGAWADRGYATPLERARAERPGVDLDAWARAARRLLDGTESAWHAMLSGALAAAGLPGAAPRAIDLSRALALPRWSRWFREALPGDVLDHLTRSWDVRLRDLPGLEIDVAAGPRRHPAPRAFRPRVPGETWLVVASRGPVRDLTALLDLGGRALADAFVSESLAFERRVPGDAALGHAWGALLRDRVQDPAWADDGPPAARAAAWLVDARVLRLGPLRRLAARAIGVLELAALPADAPAGALADAHAARMRDALGVDWSGHALLRDLCVLPRAVDALRGACLAAQLAEKLRSEHGRAFWRARGCGELLKELWNTGSTYDAQGLASQLDLGALDVDFLISECTRQ